MVENNNRKVILIGRLPAKNEVGGITTFIYNLSDKYIDFIEKVIDIYPTSEKIKPNKLNVQVLTGVLVLRLLKLFLINFSNSKIFHYNFSTTSGILPLIIFPKFKNTKWLLTLHNGEQTEKFNNAKAVKKVIIKTVLKRFDMITVISQKQYDFYSSIVDIDKLFFISPYIQNLNTIESERKDSIEFSFLISGFPIEIYRHIETIKVLNSLWKLGYSFKLNLCIYGFDTEKLLKKIKKMIKNNSNIFYHSHLDNDSFNKVLSETDIYIRMNSVDSFGLVVAEAIDKGITVFTTDVCDRYPGAYLLNIDDFKTLKQELINALEYKRINLVKSISNPKIIEFNEIYSKLNGDII